jgi:hypothetical protein
MGPESEFLGAAAGEPLQRHSGTADVIVQATEPVLF